MDLPIPVDLGNSSDGNTDGESRSDESPSDESPSDESLGSSVESSSHTDGESPSDVKSQIKNENIGKAVSYWFSKPDRKTKVQTKYGHISEWDVSRVTNMSTLFKDKYTFNDDISRWNVSSVTDMSDMFNGAVMFNQPIGNWDVSNVTNMSGMFHGANKFNQPIGNWDVSKVTDMSNMFNSAIEFNENLTNWNDNIHKNAKINGVLRLTQLHNIIAHNIGAYDIIKSCKPTDNSSPAYTENIDASNKYNEARDKIPSLFLNRYQTYGSFGGDKKTRRANRKRSSHKRLRKDKSKGTRNAKRGAKRTRRR